MHRKLSSHQQTHQTRQKKNTNKETTIERWECAIVVVDVLLICPGAQVAWSSNRSNKTTTLKREGNDEEQQHGWAWRVVVGLPSIVSSPCRDPFSWIVRSLSFTFSLSHPWVHSFNLHGKNNNNNTNPWVLVLRSEGRKEKEREIGVGA